MNTNDILAAYDERWTTRHSRAANREGWDLFDSQGSIYGPLQIQSIDDPEMWGKDRRVKVPEIDGDYAAHAIVRQVSKPHHVTALALLYDFNPVEYEAVMGDVDRVANET